MKILKKLLNKLCFHTKWEPDGVVPVNWDLVTHFHCPAKCARCGKKTQIPNYMFKTWPKKLVDKTRRVR